MTVTLKIRLGLEAELLKRFANIEIETPTNVCCFCGESDFF